jgi:AraC-like DNA-binding protein
LKSFSPCSHIIWQSPDICVRRRLRSLSPKPKAKQEKKTLLPENELENLKAKLLDLMENEKPFLDSQLTLGALSKMFGVNTTVLSRVINTGFNKNFNDFVNEFRIDEVKNKLASGAAEKTNLLGIALDSGFNSKATFNRAFKKFTGVAPTEFQGK